MAKALFSPSIHALQVTDMGVLFLFSYENAGVIMHTYRTKSCSPPHLKVFLHPSFRPLPPPLSAMCVPVRCGDEAAKNGAE